MTNLDPKNRPCISSVLRETYFSNENLNRISLALDIEKLNGFNLNFIDPTIVEKVEKINNNRASILSEEVRFYDLCL
jgi:hypothetical protein